MADHLKTDIQNSSGQLYIGAPNGVVLCIDMADENSDTPVISEAVRARLYHGYAGEPFEVTSVAAILPVMEKLFDDLRFPQPTTNLRSFSDLPAGKRRSRRSQTAAAGHVAAAVKAYTGEGRIMTDDELLGKRGELITFIIRVQQRNNSDWQGRITWIERDETLKFRSVWELLKLIDAAIELKLHT